MLIRRFFFVFFLGGGGGSMAIKLEGERGQALLAWPLTEELFFWLPLGFWLTAARNYELRVVISMSRKI